MTLPDEAISSTTQNHVPIADIVDNLILYKSGGAAIIMESTSLNFGLLSEKEQQAVIAAYAGLLNSLTFPIQIVVRSQRKDITKYTQLLEDAKSSITNPKLINVMEGYQRFIFDSIKKKNVLSKKFYIIVPFTNYELGVSKSMKTSFFNKNENTTLPYTKSYVVRKAKITLYPKRDHIARQSGRLGLFLTQLKNDDLIRLLYNLYNPVAPVKDETVFGK